MGIQLYANNAVTTLSAPITSPSAVTLNVASAALFPSPTNGDWFIGTIQHIIAGLVTAQEEVRVNSVSGTTMSIERNVETPGGALTWAIGDTFSLLWTAGGANQFLQPGSIYPDLTPGEQIVQTALGHDIIVNPQYPPMYADRYGTNTGIGFDSAPMFGVAFLVTQASFGGKISYGATAPYYTQTPINCTSASGAEVYPWTLEGPGRAYQLATQSIIAIHGGNTWNHIIDLTGTLAPTLRGVALGTLSNGAAYNGATPYVPGMVAISGGTQYVCIANTTGNAPPNATYWALAQYPTTGIFQSRASAGISVGQSRFDNVSVVGNFTNSPYYNFAAEDIVLTGCIFNNGYQGAPTRAQTVTGYNISGLTSNFQTVYGNGSPTGASCLGHLYMGCEFYSTSNYATSGTSASDVTFLDAVGDYQEYGTFSFARNSGTAIRSNVYIYLGNGPSSQCLWDAYRTDTANTSTNAFACSNDANFIVECEWRNIFTAGAPGGWALAGLTGGGSQTMLTCRINQWSEASARGIQWPGTAIDCVFNTGELQVTVGTAGVGNSFKGNTAQLTISGSGTMQIENTHAGQQQGWLGASGGAVIANYNAASSTTTIDRQVIAELVARNIIRGDWA